MRRSLIAIAATASLLLALRGSAQTGTGPSPSPAAARAERLSGLELKAVLVAVRDFKSQPLSPERKDLGSYDLFVKDQLGPKGVPVITVILYSRAYAPSRVYDIRKSDLMILTA